MELFQFIGSIHPVFASLPLPLVLAALFWELFCFIYVRQYQSQVNSFLDFSRGMTLFLLAGASVGIILAFITGYIAQDFADQSFCVPNQAIALHFIWGRILLIGLVPLWGAILLVSLETVKKVAHWVIFMGALSVLFATVLVTSNLGGKLVFNHGAGVNVEAVPKVSNCPEES